MLLFIRKIIKVFGGQNKGKRNAKVCSTNSDHYAPKILKYCEHGCLFYYRKKMFWGFDRGIPKGRPTEI
jgi:hypothetical protein